MIQRRQQLWHGRYDHCVRFAMPEASVLRHLDHLRIDKTIKVRREWGKRMMSNPGSWVLSWHRTQITDKHVANLHAMCDFLLADSRDRKIVISGDVVHVYTTDMTLVQDVMALPYVSHTVHRQIRAVGQPNTVSLKNPRHAWRSYFRQRQMTIEQKNNIVKFLTSQTDLRLSPSMKWFLTSEHQTRMYDYYFVDHDDAGFITMLSLIAPGIIRRTLPIVTDK
jgi:hypothetical protein